MYNDTVHLLNKLKCRLVVNSKIFKIHLNFICQPASLLVVRPGCATCRALEISHNKDDGGGFMEMLQR